MYALAVGGVILAVDLVVAGLYAWSIDWPIAGPQFGPMMRLRLVPAWVWLYGAAGTALVILAVSGWNVLKLSSGGRAVAEMAGARRIDPGTRDPLERRLLNVVEEMAIASGVRVPAVHVMEREPGINAFAAGFEPSDCVVAVTRGTLETLNRDELQGVVAHEFSHILNGDMRLNIRMIGVLAGIVFIGSIGQFLLRSRGGDSKGAAPVMLGGLALLLIGYIGLFFARLIKAAASRQREFLADASSVQFTRNPDGIAGALDQIRASSTGALIGTRHAEDLSHMFFCQGIVVRLHGLFDTHPPIDERIARVHAGFDRTAYRRARATSASPEQLAEAEERRRAAAVGVLAAAGSVDLPGRRGADIGAEWGRSAGQGAALVGTTDGAKVDYAARLLNSLPPDLRERLRDAEGARGAVVALAVAPHPEVAKQQLQALADKGLGALAEQARRAELLTRRLGAAFRLPVVDLALPVLKSLPENEKNQLLRGLEAVIHADRRVSLHEFALLTLMRSQLAPRRKPGAAGAKRLADLPDAVHAVLSLVAHAGIRQDATGTRAEAVAVAMAAGYREMGLPAQPAAGALTLEIAGAALDLLQQLAPMQKAILVKGLFATVTADGTIRVIEAELMRLVGAVLDCPLPPLLEAVDPANLSE